MDPRVVIIVMAMEADLERKKQETRRMIQLLRARRVALQEKDNERALLMRKKQEMLAKEAGKQKLVDDFMVFIEAIEGNNMENTQNFDEKAMMDAIESMIQGEEAGHSRDN